MIGWKAVKKIHQNLFATGNIGGSKYTEFRVGQIYETIGEIELCKNGLHFYKPEDFVFGIYLFGEKTCFIEIETLGEIKSDTNKLVTNRLKVLRYIPKKEWKKLIKKNWNSGSSNSGSNNSGNFNSGIRNSGYWNSGSSNSGNDNSGNCNSGNNNSGIRNSGNNNSGYSNSGNCNSGNGNSGNKNSGNGNSGDLNSGNYNSGSFNQCNYESGFFNSQSSKLIRVFNQEIERKKWDDCIKPSFIFFNIDYKKTYKKNFQDSWNNTTEEDRKLVEQLPNFDWNIFTEISGIQKPKDWN